MGFIGKEMYEKAGDYLLSMLRKKDILHYRIFYDGTELTERMHADAMGITYEEAEEYVLAALVDEATYQLKVEGLVETPDNGETLADGEDDYDIVLTDKGRAFIESGAKFSWRSMER